ncbi:MAG TPA: phenylacetate-CoA oxygenase subunit PaaJ [Pseudothauera hydrothermalis]|jgi:ring-1,2-phenylacetyl-CoA epoxidase subunit PaaD|nr:phenylacetate-CoA oxygenase subunit PaaJ [Rhodocyclaceae bacterium]HNQ75687.1 phenylacetate-CoA oxygenase subunit PaaJ [Pseudothauera hydrothermalis]
MLNETQAWQVLEGVPDPEIPVVSVVELGIVRELVRSERGLRVVVTPTYSGCPATEVIAESIRSALQAAGAGQVDIETRLDPAWTTDWINDAAREKLRAYGIAPPSGKAAVDGVRPIRFVPRLPPCPHCGAADTERLSEYGATACKALYRCGVCREPFEYFKPI